MRRALVLAGLLLAAGGAMAQQPELAPSPAAACLSPPPAQRGAPAYPFEAFKAQLSGDVKVRLRFAGPDLAPAVTVLSRSGEGAFVDAVRQHVATYRVPCHDGAAPVDLDFDFVFRPDATPLAPVPVDPADVERQRLMQCLEHRSGRNMPTFPVEALRQGRQGRVVAEMRFEAPDQPPKVRLLPRVGGDSVTPGWAPTDAFLRMLRAWTADYRMPCHAGGAVIARQTFHFRFDGSHSGFQAGLTLRDLLPLVRNIQQQRLQFDFTQMQCPFDVELWYVRPNLANAVRPVGAHVAARQPFVDWLAQLQFDLPEQALDHIYGDTLRFTVPCLKIDLNPQE